MHGKWFQGQCDPVSTLPLHLPSRFVLDLNNCYLVPALSTNIIYWSCLMWDGYSFKSKHNGCSVYMSNIFYGHAPLLSGLFLLNLDRDDTHVHNIEAKRCKGDNDSATYLWHCHLGHIIAKRMKNSMLMDFWNHLIMNHLMLANHASWARWLRLHSPEQWSEQLTYWK